MLVLYYVYYDSFTYLYTYPQKYNSLIPIEYKLARIMEIES